MVEESGNLGPAQRGYIHQDVVTAYFMAVCLSNQSGTLIVNRKFYTGDRFDDLTVRHGNRVVRRQFKRSDDANRALRRADFTQDQDRLRLDQLIRTYKLAGDCDGYMGQPNMVWVTERVTRLGDNHDGDR